MLPDNKHLKTLMHETFTNKEVIDEFDRYDNDLRLKHAKTVKMLSLVRKPTRNKINGALKQTINSHGPITKELIGSATKRILGSLYTEGFSRKQLMTSSVTTLLIGFLIGLFIFI